MRLSTGRPLDGYGFSAKQKYRRHVWRSLLRGLEDAVAGLRVATIIDKDPDEIEVMLAHGIREENIHIINNEKAIVAVHKRRFPAIQTYGVGAIRAFQRIKADGGIDCVNLDLCGGASIATKLACSGAQKASRTGLRLALTVMRGRESPTTTDALRSELSSMNTAVFVGDHGVPPWMTDLDELRFLQVIGLGGWFKSHCIARYRSGTKTMMYTVGTWLPCNPSDLLALCKPAMKDGTKEGREMACNLFGVTDSAIGDIQSRLHGSHRNPAIRRILANRIWSRPEIAVGYREMFRDKYEALDTTMAS